MKNWATLEADIDLILPGNRWTTGRRGHQVEFLVVHHNAGSLTAQQIHDLWVTQRTASAHYQVDRQGVVSQHVWDRDAAWHANNEDANLRSIGIEHANGSGETGLLTAKTLEEGAHLAAALCHHYQLGRPAWGGNIRPHNMYSQTLCPGPLGTVQRDTYMTRARAHYDAIKSGTAVPDSSTKGSTMVDRFPLTWEETKSAAANGAASVKYGTEGQPGFYTWGSAFPAVYDAAKQIPGLVAAVQALATEVTRLSTRQASLAAAIETLRALVVDEAASDDIDVDAIVAAVTEAGEAAAGRAVEVLREALDGATVTLDTIDTADTADTAS